MTNVSFRISSSLKTIIGKELITDDFIAIFELVKNAFDAHAKRVDICFDGDTKSGSPTRITIYDNGDGMDKDDIDGKWLFVAYSSKRLDRDYRDRIKSERVFAGAKGIGRFSCDRLGAQLTLTTRKRTEKGAWHVLEVDWSKFEEDPEREFQKIRARYSTTPHAPISGLRHGTVLELSALRSSDWDRQKLLKMRRSLERLVNPNQGNDAENFSIYLRADSEREEDQTVTSEVPNEPWRIVNGPIRNFLFESLDLKTTQIQVEIDKDAQYVLTRLADRGNQIYELLERNPYPQYLKDIKISLFHLNRAAKMAFTRRMGLPPVQYGSIFLYKNGFRIHPFGDAGEDGLGIDARKQQGAFRFLGTRDLSGRIEVNGANQQFQETSSRDGGLIRNEAFNALKAFTQQYALKRLEVYVSAISKYGLLGDYPEVTDPDRPELRWKALGIIEKLTQSNDIVDFNFDPKVLDLRELQSHDSLASLLRNLNRISSEANNAELGKEVKRAEKRMIELANEKEEAEKAEERERMRASAAEAEAQEAIQRSQTAEQKARDAETTIEKISSDVAALDTQNLFLKGVLSRDLEHVLTLHHSVGQHALTIEQFVASILRMIDGEPAVDYPRLRRALTGISLSAKKIDSLSRFATRANFRAEQEELVGDLVGFAREYLLNVYEGVLEDPNGNKISLGFHQGTEDRFVTRFVPLSVSMVLDNLLSNSRKHGAKNITISTVECTSDKLLLSFVDDGRGIPPHNIDKVFELGFSTTDGSGLGLYHVRDLMSRLKGKVSARSDFGKSTEFILEFTRRS